MQADLTTAAKIMGLTERHFSITHQHILLLKDILEPTTNRLIEAIASSDLAVHLVGVDADRLANALLRHWENVFEHGFGHDYSARVTRVGIAHRERGILPKIYLQSYGWLASRLLETLALTPSLEAEERAELIAAVTKLIFFDMAMAVGAYDAALLD